MSVYLVNIRAENPKEPGDNFGETFIVEADNAGEAESKAGKELKRLWKRARPFPTRATKIEQLDVTGIIK